jgi:hypothetical protein
MIELFFKLNGIAVLVFLLNLNPLINTLLTENLNLTGQNKSEVAVNITDNASTAVQIKSSTKNLNISIHPKQKSLYTICKPSNSICYQREMYLNFPSLKTKFPRWSKSTFT